jgi:hypothetical protein
MVTAGDIFVTGVFSSAVDFNPGSDVDQRTSNGMADVFLMRLMQDGSW